MFTYVTEVHTRTMTLKVQHWNLVRVAVDNMEIIDMNIITTALDLRREGYECMQVKFRTGVKWPSGVHLLISHNSLQHKTLSD